MQPFVAVIIDSPWRLDDQGSRIAPGACAAAYQTMSLDELKALPVPAIMAPDSMIALWRLASMQVEALELLAHWGYVVKAEVVWCKVTRDGTPHIGMGHYTRNAHEVALIATRGRVQVADKSIPSWFAAPRSMHSAKPDDLHDMIEAWFPDGPWLELFARRTRPGWTVLGNQIAR